MGQALYRKYRSKSLSEIVGQEHITTTLTNALKKGSISHAYLFTGPRGVGKTSIARILAYEVNGLPYDETASHLDIIEIDAASNRRIDEIRELRERVHTAPANAQYKVYIIDEVHMLTKEAFNALLKTLEEPPAHAIFVLATTESHKLPETIISRTQRFTFKPIDLEKTKLHLRHIANSEKIDIEDDALELIAIHGDGSFRDSISLLDQTRHHDKKITRNDIESMLGIAPTDIIEALLNGLVHGNMQAILQTLNQSKEKGYHAAGMAKQLASKLRNDLLNKTSNLPHEMTAKLLTQLIDVPASHDPDALLEIVLLETALSASPTPNPPHPITPAATNKEEPAPHKDVRSPKTKTVVEPPKEKPKKEEQEKKPEVKPQPKKAKSTDSSKQIDAETWTAVLDAIKKKHNTLYSLARMAQPEFTPGNIKLSLAFPFHLKRINDSKNKQVITEILAEVTGEPITIECVLDKQAKASSEPKPTTKAVKVDSPLDTISNIFGNAEVIE